MRNLFKQHFGYDEFLPLQEEIISTVLAGNDALASGPDLPGEGAKGGGADLVHRRRRGKWTREM